MENNDLHYYKSAKFIKSITSIKEAPAEKLSEVLFVGKSNVGKSSLINALTNNKKLAFTSSNPGHTRLLNYFLIENYFYFVDAPGYGFSAQKDKDYAFYGNMIESYFDNNPNLKCVIFLLDSRRIPNEDDILFYNFIKSSNYPYLIVMTKCDKLNMSMKSKIKNNLKNTLKINDFNEIILCSINDKRSLFELKNKISQYIN